MAFEPVKPPAPVVPVKPDDAGHKFIGTCEGGDTAMSHKLSRYPNLVHLGKGPVITHGKQKPVDDIAQFAVGSGLVKALDAEAARHGIDLDELCDALRFARAHKAI